MPAPTPTPTAALAGGFHFPWIWIIGGAIGLTMLLLILRKGYREYRSEEENPEDNLRRHQSRFQEISAEDDQLLEEARELVGHESQGESLEPPEMSINMGGIELSIKGEEATETTHLLAGKGKKQSGEALTREGQLKKLDHLVKEIQADSILQEAISLRLDPNNQQISILLQDFTDLDENIKTEYQRFGIENPPSIVARAAPLDILEEDELQEGSSTPPSSDSDRDTSNKKKKTRQMDHGSAIVFSGAGPAFRVPMTPGKQLSGMTSVEQREYPLLLFLMKNFETRCNNLSEGNRPTEKVQALIDMHNQFFRENNILSFYPNRSLCERCYESMKDTLLSKARSIMHSDPSAFSELHVWISDRLNNPFSDAASEREQEMPALSSEQVDQQIKNYKDAYKGICGKAWPLGKQQKTFLTDALNLFRHNRKEINLLLSSSATSKNQTQMTQLQSLKAQFEAVIDFIDFIDYVIKSLDSSEKATQITEYLSDFKKLLTEKYNKVVLTEDSWLPRSYQAVVRNIVKRIRQENLQGNNAGGMITASSEQNEEQPNKRAKRSVSLRNINLVETHEFWSDVKKSLKTSCQAAMQGYCHVNASLEAKIQVKTIEIKELTEQKAKITVLNEKINKKSERKLAEDLIKKIDIALIEARLLLKYTSLMQRILEKPSDRKTGLSQLAVELSKDTYVLKNYPDFSRLTEENYFITQYLHLLELVSEKDYAIKVIPSRVHAKPKKIEDDNNSLENDLDESRNSGGIIISTDDKREEESASLLREKENEKEAEEKPSSGSNEEMGHLALPPSSLGDEFALYIIEFRRQLMADINDAEQKGIGFFREKYGETVSKYTANVIEDLNKRRAEGKNPKTREVTAAEQDAGLKYQIMRQEGPMPEPLASFRQIIEVLSTSSVEEGANMVSALEYIDYLQEQCQWENLADAIKQSLVSQYTREKLQMGSVQEVEENDVKARFELVRNSIFEWIKERYSTPARLTNTRENLKDIFEEINRIVMLLEYKIIMPGFYNKPELFHAYNKIQKLKAILSNAAFYQELKIKDKTVVPILKTQTKGKISSIMGRLFLLAGELKTDPEVVRLQILSDACCIAFEEIEVSLEAYQNENLDKAEQALKPVEEELRKMKAIDFSSIAREKIIRDLEALELKITDIIDRNYNSTADYREQYAILAVKNKFLQYTARDMKEINLLHSLKQFWSELAASQAGEKELLKFYQSLCKLNTIMIIANRFHLEKAFGGLIIEVRNLILPIYRKQLEDCRKKFSSLGRENSKDNIRAIKTLEKYCLEIRESVEAVGQPDNGGLAIEIDEFISCLTCKLSEYQQQEHNNILGSVLGHQFLEERSQNILDESLLQHLFRLIQSIVEVSMTDNVRSGDDFNDSWYQLLREISDFSSVGKQQQIPHFDEVIFKLQDIVVTLWEILRPYTREIELIFNSFDTVEKKGARLQSLLNELETGDPLKNFKLLKETEQFKMLRDEIRAKIKEMKGKDTIIPKSNSNSSLGVKFAMAATRLSKSVGAIHAARPSELDEYQTRLKSITASGMSAFLNAGHDIESKKSIKEAEQKKLSKLITTITHTKCSVGVASNNDMVEAFESLEQQVEAAKEKANILENAILIMQKALKSVPQYQGQKLEALKKSLEENLYYEADNDFHTQCCNLFESIQQEINSPGSIKSAAKDQGNQPSKDDITHKVKRDSASEGERTADAAGGSVSSIFSLFGMGGNSTPARKSARSQSTGILTNSEEGLGGEARKLFDELPYPSRLTHLRNPEVPGWQYVNEYLVWLPKALGSLEANRITESEMKILLIRFYNTFTADNYCKKLSEASSSERPSLASLVAGLIETVREEWLGSKAGQRKISAAELKKIQERLRENPHEDTIKSQIQELIEETTWVMIAPPTSQPPFSATLFGATEDRKDEEKAEQEETTVRSTSSLDLFGSYSE